MDQQKLWVRNKFVELVKAYRKFYREACNASNQAGRVAKEAERATRSDVRKSTAKGEDEQHKEVLGRGKDTL